MANIRRMNCANSLNHLIDVVSDDRQRQTAKALDIVVKVTVFREIVGDAGLLIPAVSFFGQGESVARHSDGRVTDLGCLTKLVVEESFLLSVVKILVDLERIVFAILRSLPDIGGGAGSNFPE